MFSSFLQNLKFREAAEETTNNNNTPKKQDGGTVRRQIIYAQSPETAQKVSAVYAAIRILSEAAASLTMELQVWNRQQERYINCDETPAERQGVDFDTYYALAQSPNAWMSSFTFMKTLVSELYLHGNAYVAWTKNAFGKPNALYLLSPNTYYDPRLNKYIVHEGYYTFLNGLYDAKDIIHIKNVSLDGGFTGVSTIHFAATQLNIAATSANETLDRFATGGRGKFLYHNNTEEGGGFSQGEFDDDELLNNGNDIQSQLNEGRDVIVMRGDGKLEPMSMSAADLQFLSSEEFNIREIARYFGVPLSKLFEKGDQTYKSADAANLALYSEALRPLLTNIEEEFARKLIDKGQFTMYRIRFNTDPMYLTDKLSEQEYLTKRISNGTMTPNEARAYMNLGPIEGGDIQLVSTNLAAPGNSKIKNDNDNTEGNPATEPTNNKQEEDEEPED